MRKTSATGDDWLIADVGATTSRCAIVQAGNSVLHDVRIFQNRNFTSPAEVLAKFIATSTQTPQHCALAIAAPVHGDDVQMINRDWHLNRQSLADELGFVTVRILNDFHAVACALPALDDQSRVEIGKASAYRDGNMAVLGPGSGLGMAARIGDRAAGSLMSGEGGHVTLAGRNKQEDRIIDKFRQRFGHCSAERVLSGPGLRALHAAMHDIELPSPEEISGNTADERCMLTMRQFFSFLGSVAADLALVTGAFGGVYIAGGIVPACIEQIMASPFRERFEDKNRYRDYMQRIPTYVITDPYPGLRGLQAYLSAPNSP